MVRHCANPACRAELRSLRGGALYALERRSSDTEFFWLCPQCGATRQLIVDDGGAVALADIRQHHAAPRPEGYLRRISLFGNAIAGPTSRFLPPLVHFSQPAARVHGNDHRAA